MDDDFIQLNNTCADLVAFKKWEAFPLHLLGDRRAGEWVSVRDMCRQLSLDVGEVKPDLFVAWMNDPLGNDAYEVIIFYDDESKWTMAAHYNREHLFQNRSPNQSPQTVTATPAS
jgi:hypothetical protein